MNNLQAMTKAVNDLSTSVQSLVALQAIERYGSVQEMTAAIKAFTTSAKLQTVKAPNDAPCKEPLTAKDAIKGTAYTILSTSSYYQSYVGKCLVFDSLLNAHWGTFLDESDRSETGAPMRLHLPVGTQIEAYKGVAVGQIVACHELTEDDMGYVYEVVQGADQADLEKHGKIIVLAKVYHSDIPAYYLDAKTSDGWSTLLNRDTKLKRLEDNYEGH